MKTSMVITIVVGILIMSGCASSKISRNNAIPMEIKDTKNVSVVRAKDYMDNKSLIVSGAVKRDHFFRSAAYGHVDILFLDSDDHIVKESNVRYLPIHLSTEHSSSLFKETFDGIPEGTKQIVVAYHNKYFFDENHHSQ